MQAILIDPADQSVKTIQIGSSYSSIEVRLEDSFWTQTLMIGMGVKDTLFHAWVPKPQYTVSGIPCLGKSIIAHVAPMAMLEDATMTVEQVKEMIKWL